MQVDTNAARGLAPLLLLTVLGCGEGGSVDSRKAVVITPVFEGGLDGHIGSFAAIPLLQGVLPSDGIEIFAPDEKPFTLRLPAGARGRFTIEIEAVADPEGNTGTAALGSGHGEVVIGDGMRYDLEIKVTPPTCGAMEWCWANTQTWTQDLTAVWGSSIGDLWAVGTLGTVLRRSPFSWTRVDAGVTGNLNGVWGSGPQDVWVVGARGTAQHFDGRTWSKVDTGTSQDLVGVWGSGPNDVWVIVRAGEGGEVRRYQGASFKLITETPTVPRGISGGGPDDIWIVGDFGLSRHFDGTAFADVPSGTTAGLTQVWSAGHNDVWATGIGGRVQHYTGTWTDVSSGTSSELRGISGTGATDVWFAGRLGVTLHLENSRLRSFNPVTENALNAVFAHTEDEAWIVGDFGVLLRWDGSKWSDGAPTARTL